MFGCKLYVCCRWVSSAFFCLHLVNVFLLAMEGGKRHILKTLLYFSFIFLINCCLWATRCMMASWCFWYSYKYYVMAGVGGAAVQDVVPKQAPSRLGHSSSVKLHEAMKRMMPSGQGWCCGHVVFWEKCWGLCVSLWSGNVWVSLTHCCSSGSCLKLLLAVRFAQI